MFDSDFKLGKDQVRHYCSTTAVNQQFSILSHTHLCIFVCLAEDFLSFSFQHCHRSSQKNKRMILIYLLPVKMLLVTHLHSSIHTA